MFAIRFNPSFQKRKGLAGRAILIQDQLEIHAQEQRVYWLRWGMEKIVQPYVWKTPLFMAEHGIAKELHVYVRAYATYARLIPPKR